MKKENPPDPGVVASCTYFRPPQAADGSRFAAPPFKTEPAMLGFGFAVVATADSLRGRCVGVIDYVVPAKPMHGLCG